MTPPYYEKSLADNRVPDLKDGEAKGRDVGFQDGQGQLKRLAALGGHSYESEDTYEQKINIFGIHQASALFKPHGCEYDTYSSPQETRQRELWHPRLGPLLEAQVEDGGDEAPVERRLAQPNHLDMKRRLQYTGSDRISFAIQIALTCLSI